MDRTDGVDDSTPGLEGGEASVAPVLPTGIDDRFELAWDTVDLDRLI